jgi:hypothetical protein
LDTVREGVITSVFEEDNAAWDPNILVKKAQSPKPSSENSIIRYVLIAAFIVFSIFGIKFEFFDPISNVAVFSSQEWRSMIKIEHKILVEHEESSYPVDAINPTSFPKLVGSHQEKTGNQIQDGYDLVEDTSKTNYFDCSETTGNGAAEKKTCSSHPTKSVPKYVDETETVNDYAKWYRYQRLEWVFDRDEESLGGDLKPYWPSYTLAKTPPERVSSQQQYYTVNLKNSKSGKLFSIYPNNETKWKTYKKGQKYQYNTNRAGMKISEPQLLIKGNR